MTTIIGLRKSLKEAIKQESSIMLVGMGGRLREKK
jgi:hypothetical protein